jgi:Na+:H+ antiporter, NhaA family
MKKRPIDSELTSPIREEDHVAGPKTAAVTLVAYCDFECLYCGRAYPIIELLQARLRFVFRHFPLSTHRETRLRSIGRGSG